ncbi:hypothetical protein CALVIDRAFT_569301 [Calocera viscosa TUFC12733]|uniref:Uncharacterized protein n=1 Tax=Calocera viscosa (strain TUFC12733) TaxID=1330018 RepID=A0A167G5N0_CALVF|nr:hypothetical protein CALVIDRAFT_569301 [Calocera viscosa TUFC12733]
MADKQEDEGPRPEIEPNAPKRLTRGNDDNVGGGETVAHPAPPPEHETEPPAPASHASAPPDLGPWEPDDSWRQPPIPPVPPLFPLPKPDPFFHPEDGDPTKKQPPAFPIFTIPIGSNGKAPTGRHPPLIDRRKD